MKKILLDQIKQDLIKALKERNELKASTLRILIGAVKNFEIEKQGTSYEASDDEIISVIQKQVKQRKDSIGSYKSAGRAELAEKETKELEILQNYLPEMIGEEEIEKLVGFAIKETGASSISDIGMVMGKLTTFKGRVDMGRVSSIVKQKLSA